MKFNIYENLEKVNANSLLIESDREVASLEIGNYYLSLMCRGGIKVYYKDNIYYNADELPKKVKNYLLGKIERLEDFSVIDNNWLQFEIYKILDKEKNGTLKLESIDNINNYLDVADIEGTLDNKDLEQSLYNVFIEELKYLKENYSQELKDLKI